MRTKKLLSVAAGVLCAASVLAVTSVNVVGYVNVDLVSGFNLVAPPLKAASDTIGAVLPTVPNGTTIQKWNPALQQFDSPILFDTDIFGGWEVPDAPIIDGEAIMINVVDPVTVTFVGDVRQGANLDTALVPGFNFVGSQVPQVGGITSVLAFAPENGDTCQQWNGGAQGYDSPLLYDVDIFGGWEVEPVLGMAEGVVLTRTAPGTWSRSFTVQ